MTINRRNLLMTAGAAFAASACAPLRAGGDMDADVIIIGAGLSGLHAASTLENAGAKVLVLEGANRVGGRLHTLYDLPGGPDAGGIQIGSNYTRLIAIADRLGVALQPGGEFERTALYNIRGKSVRQEEWAAAEVNRLVGPERQVPPAALAQIFARKLPALSSLAAWRSEEGFKLDVPYGAALKAAGASDEAIRLMAANLNGNDINSLSALNVARSAAAYRAAGPGVTLNVITGGSQRLPEAMAKALKSEVRLNQIVTGISEDASGVRVEIGGGQSLRARHIICTIPFSVLRGIGLSGPSADAVKTAIATVPYTTASFAYLSASEAFWKQDGLPGTIWSDDPMLGRVFVIGEAPAMLKVWLAGPDAVAIDRMAPQAAGAAIIAKIEAARPSARGKLTLLRMYSWQNNPMARGIYHHIGAGQARLLAAATAETGHRLHFAGEHLSQNATGIEGALETGERAAQMVVAKL